MKVVLIKDIKNKGKRGDVIEVNSTYAQNYLIPNGFAKIGNNNNLNEAMQAKASLNYKDEQNRLHAIEIKKVLENSTISIKTKTGQNGKLFGSITNKEISDELMNKFNFDIDKKKIDVDQIKMIGVYKANIKLYPSISAIINVEIIAL